MWRSSWKNQQGGILIHALMFMTFVSLMVVSYAGLMHQAQQTTQMNYYQRQAANNAFTGIEYAIKRILLQSLLQWQETLQIDGNSSARIRVTHRNHQVTIQSVGIEKEAVFPLTARFTLMDIRQYPLIVSGNVEGVEIKMNHSAVPQNSPPFLQTNVLPLFDVANANFQPQFMLSAMASANDDGLHALISSSDDDDDDDDPDDEVDPDDDFNRNPNLQVLFQGKHSKNPLITGHHFLIKNPPPGRMRFQPVILYLPLSNSHIEINSKKPISMRGLVVIHGNIEQRGHYKNKENQLVIHSSPAMIQQLYRRYSVNQAPYIIQNLIIYAN